MARAVTALPRAAGAWFSWVGAPTTCKGGRGHVGTPRTFLAKISAPIVGPHLCLGASQKARAGNQKRPLLGSGTQKSSGKKRKPRSGTHKYRAIKPPDHLSSLFFHLDGPIAEFGASVLEALFRGLQYSVLVYLGTAARCAQRRPLPAARNGRSPPSIDPAFAFVVKYTSLKRAAGVPSGKRR